MGESRERSDLRRWVGLWVGYSEMTMDGRLYRYMKVRVSLFLFSYLLFIIRSRRLLSHRKFCDDPHTSGMSS